MLTGISTASFFTKLYTEETFSYLKQFNTEICEVFFGCTSEYNGIYTDSIIEAARNSGITVHSVHGLTNQYEPELFSLNYRAAADSENILRGLLETAKTLGAHNYTLHGPARLKNKPYIHNYDRLADVVNRLCGIAGEYDIKINYENVHWAFFNNPEYFIELKKRCPQLGATLDVKQAILSDISYAEFFNAVKDRLNTVHVCDVDTDKKMLLPGRGAFDYVDLYKRLSDVGFKGAVLMEAYPESYDEFNEIKQAYEYLLECADKAGVECDYLP